MLLHLSRDDVINATATSAVETVEITSETNVTNTNVSSYQHDTIPVHDSVKFASANPETTSPATKAAQHVEAAYTPYFFICYSRWILSSKNYG